jgi:hypothetical protein
MSRRKTWTLVALVAGLIVIGLLLVPADFASSEWRKTYCRLCGATREVVVERWLWGALESAEPKVEPTAPMDEWVGPHQHDWISPPHIVFADDATWSIERKLHDARVELVYNQLWPGPAEYLGREVITGLAAQGRQRAVAVWQALIDPERYLPFGAAAIFGLQVCKDSQWALWRQLDTHYACRGRNPVRCGLTEPAWMQLRLLSLHQRSEINIDWSRWTFGLEPPAFLFGVERFEPTDAAAAARGRKLAERAARWLGLAEPAALPATLRLASAGWSAAPDGRMDWAVELYADVRAGALRLEARRGEDRFTARYTSGQGGFRQPAAGRRQPLEPNLHHGLERLLRSATSAHWLARALAEPQALLRPLGAADFAGQRAERLLIRLPGGFASLLYIGAAGRVLGARGWLRTEFGMDMVTRVNEAWSTFDGIQVATRWQLRRDGAAGVYSAGELKSFEWNTPLPPAPEPR